jgi:hypothetical protein
MIVRNLIVLLAYEHARSGGEKHSSAVTEAIAAVKRFHPDMKVSETEVKRILAELRPKDAPIVARVTEKPPMTPEECKLAGFAEGTAFNRSLVLRYGPRPKYKRANAATTKKGSIRKE